MAETYPIFVQTIALNVSDHPHPYHVDNSGLALKAWQDEIAKKPSLFNGDVMLESNLNYTKGGLQGTSHLVPYSTFLHWLQNSKGAGSHLFAIGLIISKDGLPILGEMADHTFNAGKCYAPSGSLDADDINGGEIDLLANVKRELGEETGLDLSGALIEPGFHIFRHKRKWIVVIRCQFEVMAKDLCSQINNFIANDEDAELSHVFAIDRKHHYDDAIADYMIDILDWHFDLDKDK